VDDLPSCELCGRKGFVERGRNPGGRTNIVRHHWRGYEYPDALWLICKRCNLQLRHKHDGVMDKEQSRFYVRHGGDRWIYLRCKQQAGISIDALRREHAVRVGIFRDIVLGSQRLFAPVAETMQTLQRYWEAVDAAVGRLEP